MGAGFQFAHTLLAVFIIIGIVWGCCWKNTYRPAETPGTMSRCYPYPPPGYEKKAQVELGLSPKKEKHKHKDKKRKRRKDSEINGGVHDKDKRSKDKDKDRDRDKDKEKDNRRTEPLNEAHCLENGRVLGIKAVSPAVTFESTHLRGDRVQAGSSRSDGQPLDSSNCEPALYNKERDANGKVDTELPLSLPRSALNTNGAVASDLAPSTRHSLGNDNDLHRQRHSQSTPQIEGAWSAVDDQEWLFVHNNHLPSKPKTKEEERGVSQVWAEALLLPSVDIYALPYVVPY